MPHATMPAKVIAGDSLALAFPVGRYPAANGYSVALTLVPVNGGTPVAVNATGGVQAWDILLTSSASAELAAGMHRWMVAATLSGERSTMASGDVQVLPDPAASGVDQRSPAQRALDAIDATLEGRAGKSAIKYVFEDGRSIEHMPHSELIKLRDHYARRVANEKTRRRGPIRVQMRM